MTLRSFEGAEPDVHETARVDESAVVIGDVVIEEKASVWPNVTLRGDHGTITLREGTNIQDNSVVHEGADIGPYATVGHTAIVHAATVERRGLVGMGAIVLDDAVVGEEAIVAAGSVVTEGTDVPSNTLVAGTPAEPVKDVESTKWFEAADRYVENARRHEATSEQLD